MTDTDRLAASHPSPGESAGFDREAKRLAALLHEGICSRQYAACPPAGICQNTAARLIAAGVGFRDEIDVERLARALRTVFGWNTGTVFGETAAAIAREYAKDGSDD